MFLLDYLGGGTFPCQVLQARVRSGKGRKRQYTHPLPGIPLPSVCPSVRATLAVGIAQALYQLSGRL